jgi:hypothetical protein
MVFEMPTHPSMCEADYVAAQNLAAPAEALSTCIFNNIMAYPRYLICFHQHRGLPKSILCYQQDRGFFLHFAFF